MYLRTFYPPPSHLHLLIPSESDQQQQHYQYGSPVKSTQQHNSVFDTPSQTPIRSRIRDFTPTPYVPQNSPTTTINSPYNGYGSPAGSAGYGTPGDPFFPVCVF